MNKVLLVLIVIVAHIVVEERHKPDNFSLDFSIREIRRVRAGPVVDLHSKFQAVIFFFQDLSMWYGKLNACGAHLIHFKISCL